MQISVFGNMFVMIRSVVATDSCNLSMAPTTVQVAAFMFLVLQLQLVPVIYSSSWVFTYFRNVKIHVDFYHFVVLCMLLA